MVVLGGSVGAMLSGVGALFLVKSMVVMVITIVSSEGVMVWG